MTPSVEQLEARSDIARWISATLAGPPVLPLPGVERAGLILPSRNDLAAGSLTGRSDQVEAERVRLFVNAPGGVPAAPYGSWWTEGALDGAATDRVVAHYLREGLQTEARSGPADYLPTELEFVSFLLHHQRAARLTEAADLERQSRMRESEFIRAEMLPWIPRFCQAGREAAREPFWKAVFDLVELFVESEATRSANSRSPS